MNVVLFKATQEDKNSIQNLNLIPSSWEDEKFLRKSQNKRHRAHPLTGFSLVAFLAYFFFIHKSHPGQFVGAHASLGLSMELPGPIPPWDLPLCFFFCWLALSDFFFIISPFELIYF